jgi:glycosyltransferase involved in cell wall biosynthesis
MTAGLVVTDPLRAAHLGVGDIIACVSPKAAGHYRRLCRIYGGHDLAERVKVIPHAVESGFHFAGTSKLRQIACIGRWEDHIQKRTWLMMEVIRCLVGKDESLSVMIVGNVTPEMNSWHRSLGESVRNRVHLCGHLDRNALVEVLRSSRVFYSPSAFESFGIAAAEALCCGCSVVAGRSVSMASFEWFVSENSGVLAVPDDAAGHIRSLEQELGAWDQNLREPEKIAQIWGERLHAGSVAELVLQYHRLSKNTEPIVGW